MYRGLECTLESSVLINRISNDLNQNILTISKIVKECFNFFNKNFARLDINEILIICLISVNQHSTLVRRGIIFNVFDTLYIFDSDLSYQI